MTPIDWEERTARFLAFMFGWYPNSFIAFLTRFFVSVLIRGLSAITLETVEGATPARFATSFIVIDIFFTFQNLSQLFFL